MVSLETFTIASSLDVNGSDSDPIAPTPTLAELLLFFSAYRSCSALTNAIDLLSAAPIGHAGGVELDLHVRRHFGLEVLAPVHVLGVGPEDHEALAQQARAAPPRR